ncbi:hypothetical protein BPOR_0043g00040 [Botrytis porri]|uniref:AMP-dependent synthetase/ligase domain-containing protein n=1 Tax=Botrytis porri TaxID=87229 RepID=A0A4Z1L353_9HELO|nr:hypothetical protein BPOR_0043g00040 [Botrytis porri]
MSRNLKADRSNIASPHIAPPHHLSNDPSLHYHVLQSAFNHLPSTSPQPPTVAPVVKLHDYLRVLTIPSIEELLNTTYVHFPYEKSFEEAKGEPLVALHTSGTTRLLKPVIFTRDYAAAYVRTLQSEPPEGFESLDRKSEGERTSAICVMIAAIANQTTCIFPPPAAITTAALQWKHSTHTNDVVGILGGPPLVADCAKNPELLDFFASHAGLMCYGGGDVALALGDIVSTKLDLYTSHGSTESVSYPLIRKIGDRDPKDWRYCHPHPAAELQF